MVDHVAATGSTNNHRDNKRIEKCAINTSNGVECPGQPVSSVRSLVDTSPTLLSSTLLLPDHA